MQIALGAVIEGVFQHGITLEPDLFFLACCSCLPCCLSTAGGSPRSACFATRAPSSNWRFASCCSPWSAPAT
jgi:hypothetical protein